MGNIIRYHVYLLASVAIIILWSALYPHDVFTWFLEAFPVLLAIPVLLFTYNSFRLTHLTYTLIAIHSMILLIGAHYTYAEVPLFHWLSEQVGSSRNNYDKVGHFAQGFIPAIIMRELLIRTSTLKAGKWMFAIIVFSCLGISALYELIEWLVAELTDESAEAFLGTQGDIWDTQKDMFYAGIGAILALVSLSQWHDRQLTAQHLR